MYAENIPDSDPAAAEAEVLMAERNAALREAFRDLPPRCQRADRPAHRGPTGALRGDQRQAGHQDRQHRPDPGPVPAAAPPTRRWPP